MHGKDPDIMTVIIKGTDKEETINTEKGKDMDVMTIIMIEKDWDGMITETRTGQQMRTIAEIQTN